MYSSGPGPVKWICMLRKSISAPTLISELSPSSAGSEELLIVGVVKVHSTGFPWISRRVIGK